MRDEKYGENGRDQVLFYLVFPLNVFMYLSGVHMWRSEDNPSSHVFPPVGSEAQTQVIRRGVKCLYPQSHLSLTVSWVLRVFVVALFFPDRVGKPWLS